MHTGETDAAPDSLGQDAAWDHATVARYLMRHLVAIYFDLRKGRERHQFVHTAFVLAVHRRWLLMTAGHCITDVQSYREQGYELANCKLVDHLGLGAKYREPVPFDYDGAHPAMLCRDATWDYGVLVPSHNTCQLMQANRVVALDEQWWGSEPDRIDAYYLLGIPQEYIKLLPTYVHIGPTMAALEKVDERPEGFPETDAPMFYGRLRTKPVESLRGFSGGPIFAVAQAEGGGGGYWLHAMQVSGLRGSKYISGMLMAPLCKYLREAAERAGRD